MVKPFIFILILLLLLGVTLPAMAQNPFISKDDSRQVSSEPGVPTRYPFLDKIALWQHRLNQKMAALTREARETGSPRPLLVLLFIAFTYGVLHAAGPGHGKAVAVSYLISSESKLGRGIVLGNLVALFHGLTGILLVLAVHFVLQKGVTDPLQNMTRTTQLISYSLIALLGSVLLVRSLFSWRKQNRDSEPGSTGRVGGWQNGPFAMAIAVGMVPCPGVVLVMLFCLSLDLIGLGLLLAFCLILGMAVTISAVGIAGIACKRVILRSLEGSQGRLAELIERGIETAAALVITALGLLFFAATL